MQGKQEKDFDVVWAWASVALVALSAVIVVLVFLALARVAMSADGYVTPDGFWYVPAAQDYAYHQEQYTAPLDTYFQKGLDNQQYIEQARNVFPNQVIVLQAPSHVRQAPLGNDVYGNQLNPNRAW